MALFNKEPPPAPTLSLDVRFADVVDVEGYMVMGHREMSANRYVPPPTLAITDNAAEAIACLRADPKRFLKVVRLWRCPDGRLLWKNEARVAQPDA
jgi:hypothetical protein